VLECSYAKYKYTYKILKTS